jgi:hypothetical protein
LDPTQGAPGKGGNANATATSTAGGVAAEATAIATGGAGGAATGGGAPGIGGDATATANAVSSMAAAGVTATAHSPGGGPASAMSIATIGPGAPPPVEISKGLSTSVAILAPGEAKGEMSASYGGEGETLVYETTADFSFTTSEPEPLYLTLLDFDATGNGFDRLELTVDADGNPNTPPLDYVFTSLSSAEMFFHNNAIDLGFEGAGPQVVDISLFLTASDPGDGFGFSYTVTVPEAPTWAMMLAGFAGLGYAGYRRRARPDSRLERQKDTECIGRGDVGVVSGALLQRRSQKMGGRG